MAITSNRICGAGLMHSLQKLQCRLRGVTARRFLCIQSESSLIICDGAHVYKYHQIRQSHRFILKVARSFEDSYINKYTVVRDTILTMNADICKQGGGGETMVANLLAEESILRQ